MVKLLRSSVSLGLFALALPGQAQDGPRSFEVAVHYASDGDQPVIAVRGKPIVVKLDGENGDMEAGKLEIDGKTYAVATRWTSRKKPLDFMIDRDGNGSFADNEKLSGQPVDASGRGIWRFDSGIALGDRTLRVANVRLADGVMAAVIDPGWVRGDVDIDGVTYHLVAIDRDGDGQCGGKGDFWHLLNDAELAKLDASTRGGTKHFDENSLIQADHPVFLGEDRAAWITGTTSSEITIAVGKPEHDLQHYLHLRTERVLGEWRTRFASSKNDPTKRFADASRPRTDTPVAWMHLLDLEPALARAAEEGKPVLVDFETDWCVWCKVLDMVTYPDKEVADYVTANFVPVKVNCELLDNDLTQRYEVKGYPGLAVLNAKGDKIDYISGFSPPADFIGKLKSAHGKFEKQ